MMQAAREMADVVVRRVEQYSPKSSPRGSRSPVVPRQDSTGTLKTTISLGGKNPAIVHTGPFYLMKEPPGCYTQQLDDGSNEEKDLEANHSIFATTSPEGITSCELTGAINLMAHHGLEHSYNKFSGKKVKDQLSAFLPNLPGSIDTPGQQDNSSLRSLIEKPPIGGKELIPLSMHQLQGFRLHAGPLPEQYRLMSQQPLKKKHKHKKQKLKPGDTPLQEMPDASLEGSHEKKHKKQKRHDEEKERKKKKKEKKKKKKHLPESNQGNMQIPATHPMNNQVTRSM